MMKYLYCSLLLAPLSFLHLSGCSTTPATAESEVSANKLAPTPVAIASPTPVPTAVPQPKFLPPSKVLSSGDKAWTFYSTSTTLMVSRATGGQADLMGPYSRGNL
jgi:hypothetical protein